MKHPDSKRQNLDETPGLRSDSMDETPGHTLVKEHVVKEQVVGTASLLKNGTATKQPRQTRG